jgi:hypothetical protein
MPFDYARDFTRLDFRRQPELYQIGVGEQGVLLVEPYKSEILPHWRFRTPEVARASAAAIYRLFLRYRRQGDFVGMDMARKFLQMGYTRSRRYANHKSGRKYAADGSVLPPAPDPDKAASAAAFREQWLRARADRTYQRLKRRHRELYESSGGGSPTAPGRGGKPRPVPRPPKQGGSQSRRSVGG